MCTPLRIKLSLQCPPHTMHLCKLTNTHTMLMLQCHKLLLKLLPIMLPLQ